jgi:hypothetical protein
MKTQQFFNRLDSFAAGKSTDPINIVCWNPYIRKQLYSRADKLNLKYETTSLVDIKESQWRYKNGKLVPYEYHNELPYNDEKFEWNRYKNIKFMKKLQ